MPQFLILIVILCLDAKGTFENNNLKEAPIPIKNVLNKMRFISLEFLVSRYEIGILFVIPW